ncbi:hypothetical protein IMCC3317_11560 [Kordia antarctica]|uniref:Peptidase C14 caspase domain-containing protein n=1 Tax=Kordia antarctica TaxID=1218801 RepID=A0A7L4ZGD3_9FLAO|nr:caspase family protein [Kordia antarctica]QHI35808.1 hypothetical protein IMCC3317_11560 [Kordia antarctica]
MRTILAICWLFLSFFSVNAQTKKAFLVGVGNYEDSGLGWTNISGDNDVEYLRAFLMTQGFHSKDIHLLKNEDATKQNVLDSLRSFTTTIKDSTSIVFLYFASHGQQITDSNGDEKQDQLDEAIVLYDTPKEAKYQANYKGEKHLLDDELQLIIYDIRKRLNQKGQLFMGVDACFSGTTDKGSDNLPIRGTNKKFILKDIVSKKAKDSLELKELFDTDKKLGPFILMTASEAHQVNTQYSKDLGSLTYAIVNGFNEIKGSTGISYQYFFKKNVLESFDFLEGISSQKPTLSGDITETLFNTSEITSKYSYFLTSYFPKDFRVDKNRALYLPYGKIHGITEDVIFKIIHRANDRIVGYGKVVTANETESKFICNTSIDKEILNNSLLVPIQLQYIEKSFKIQLFSEESKGLSSLYLTPKGNQPVITNKADFQLYIKKNTYTITSGKEIILLDRPIETLSNGLTYASYLQYLMNLDKKQKSKKLLDYYFVMETDETGATTIRNRKAVSYFYNIATLGLTFKVIYPNQEYRNDELFIGGKLGSKSIPMKFRADQKKVFIIEQKKTHGNYVPNLDLNKSIYNHAYLFMNEALPATIKFKMFPVKPLKRKKGFKLFIF